MPKQKDLLEKFVSMEKWMQAMDNQREANFDREKKNLHNRYAREIRSIGKQKAGERYQQGYSALLLKYNKTKKPDFSGQNAT